MQYANTLLDLIGNTPLVRLNRTTDGATRATAAFIVAGGAMVAAIAGALIAFLALRRYGFRPPW